MNMRTEIRGYLVVIFFLALNSPAALAQLKYKAFRYSVNDGLSNEKITCALRDREGFTWFGTLRGLNRFDGRSFRAYRSYVGDRSVLKNDRVMEITDDLSGNIWIRTYDRRVYRFNKKTENFTPLADIAGSSNLQDVTFARIVCKRKGAMWFLSKTAGLVYLSTQTSRPRVSYFNETAQNFRFRLKSNRINFLEEDHMGNVWLGTEKGLVKLVRSGQGQPGYEVSRIIEERSEFTTFAEDSSRLYFTGREGRLIVYLKTSGDYLTRKITPGLSEVSFSEFEHKFYYTNRTKVITSLSAQSDNPRIETISAPAPVISVFAARSGELWLEPLGSGVIRFNPSRKSFSTYANQSLKHEVDDPFFKVFQDNDGRFWIDMKGGGLGYYNSHRDRIDFLDITNHSENYRSQNVVEAVCDDPSGVIWVTTDNRRFYKIVLPAPDFQQRLLEPGSMDIHDNEVRSLLVDARERLWAATKNGKVHLFNGKQWISDIFLNSSSLPTGNIYTIFQDRHRVVWMGSKTRGLFKAVPANREETKYTLSNYRFDPSDKYSLSSNQVYAIVGDNMNRIWVGTYDKGLNLVVDSANVRFLNASNCFFNYPPSSFNRIRQMGLDKDGKLWVGTTDGLLIGDIRGTNAREYSFLLRTKTPGDKASLGNNDVRFIFRDTKSRMWVATAGGGLGLALDPYARKFLNYTTLDGLPSDFVLSCAEDVNGNLWLATSNGLSRLDPASSQIKNFNIEDRLWETIYSEASVARFTAGKLVFGTTEGYLFVDPGKIGRKQEESKIVFSGLFINNREIRPGDSSRILRFNINDTRRLTLHYDQNFISITYSGLDYRSDIGHEYEYRLLGLDSNWINNRSERSISYSKLPPGKYTLQVKNFNSSGNSPGPVKSLDITILPPPWLSWWAYGIYSVVVAALFLLVRRFVLEMLKLRHRVIVEQQMAELKLDFFTHVSHELRTPLTLIKSPVEQIGLREKLSVQGKQNLELVRKNTDRMIRYVNQLLDFRKAQSGSTGLKLSMVSLIQFVKNVCSYFQSHSVEKDVRLVVSHSEDELDIWLDTEKMEVVIFNLLSNAFKFTPAGRKIEVSVQRKISGGMVTIAVHDEGPGVQGDDLNRIFEPYYQGGNDQYTGLKGTGIGLALSREFVQIHRGNIYAVNNASGGLTVSIDLKTDPAYYSKQGISIPVDSLPVIPLTEVAGEPFQPAVKDKNLREAPMVLVVEDNRELQCLIQQELSGLFRTETAADGKQGLEKALSLAPDIILSDIMMPVMDGITMLDHLKNNVETSHIPVVLLSAKYSIKNQIEGLQYGADFYIAKPFRMDFLIASLTNLIHQRKKLLAYLAQGESPIELRPSEITITSHDELFLKKVMEVVEEHLGDENFNIDAAADLICMSRSAFFRKFKGLTNLTPVEFLREMRLKRSLQYLDAGENNISFIAYQAGFKNAKYFSTSFRQRFKKTPTEYLKSKRDSLEI